MSDNSKLINEARDRVVFVDEEDLKELIGRLASALEAAEGRAEEAEIAAEIWGNFAKTLESGKPAVVPNPRSA